ncbi:MAG TPA: YcdB/YcdC domain-containing protein, partial [Bacillota bacterium]|nr:YcdB/YcdC domain-containing protein [Bacillota bacterium]
MGIIQRKRIYMFLAGTLMFTTAAPAYAEDIVKTAKAVVSAEDQKNLENTKISKEDSLELAKKAVEIPKEYVLQNVEFQSKWWGSNSPVWIFYWNQQGQDFGNIQVAVDANNGKIVSTEVYKNPSPDSISYPPKIDTNQAKEIALNYIKNHYPDKVDQIKLDEWSQSNKPPLTGMVQYPLVYKRIVNGIPFDNNEIRVTVSGNGDVINLGYRWNDNIQFPDTVKQITQDQAKQIYSDHIDLSLHMLRAYGAKPTDGTQYFIGYTPTWFGDFGVNPSSFIRATDGAILTPWGDELNEKQFKKVRLSEQRMGNLENGSNLNQEQALKVLGKYFSLPQNTDTLRANYREQNGDNPASIWDFNWEEKGSEIPHNWSSAAIDAKTGRVLSYHSGNQIMYMKGENVKESEEKYEPKITRTEGEKIAVNLIEKLNPDLVDSIFQLHIPINPYDGENPKIYSYQFQVEKNGVTLENSGIGVNVDSKTGEILNYWFNQDNLYLPDQAPVVISLEKAQDLFMSMTQMRLAYVLPQEKPALYSEGKNPSTQALLVYQPLFKQVGEPLFLDAKSGEWLNRETGKPYRTDSSIQDIAGNPYEKELKLLLPYNVFDVKEGKINPTEEISRGEMIKILMLIQNNGYHSMIANRKETFMDVKVD